MAKDDIPVIHNLSLSQVATEVLLAMIEDYDQDNSLTNSEEFYIDMHELKDIFDHVVAADIITVLKEYNVKANLSEVVRGIREIAVQTSKIKDEDMVQVNFKKALDAF
jgi:hypothetical protein